MNNTQFETQYPCPNGTYNNQTGATSPDFCQLCTAGHYCPSAGLSEPAGLCDPGWYCVLGSWDAQPVYLGNDSGMPYHLHVYIMLPSVHITRLKEYFFNVLPYYKKKFCVITTPYISVTDCACPADRTGGKCRAGTYCPQGADAPIQCDPGYYCENDGLDTVSGPCSAGHYCTISAILRAPINETYGDICPLGHYCPEATDDPIECQPGEYNNRTGSEIDADCLPCIPGWYCPGMYNVLYHYTNILLSYLLFIPYSTVVLSVNCMIHTLLIGGSSNCHIYNLIHYGNVLGCDSPTNNYSKLLNVIVRCMMSCPEPFG